MKADADAAMTVLIDLAVQLSDALEENERMMDAVHREGSHETKSLHDWADRYLNEGCRGMHIVSKLESVIHKHMQATRAADDRAAAAELALSEKEKEAAIFQKNAVDAQEKHAEVVRLLHEAHQKKRDLEKEIQTLRATVLELEAAKANGSGPETINVEGLPEGFVGVDIDLWKQAKVWLIRDRRPLTEMHQEFYKLETTEGNEPIRCSRMHFGTWRETLGKYLVIK